jgi:hypothetical protein
MEKKLPYIMHLGHYQYLTAPTDFAEEPKKFATKGP